MNQDAIVDDIVYAVVLSWPTVEFSTRGICDLSLFALTWKWGFFLQDDVSSCNNTNKFGRRRRICYKFLPSFLSRNLCIFLNPCRFFRAVTKEITVIRKVKQIFCGYLVVLIDPVVRLFCICYWLHVFRTITFRKVKQTFCRDLVVLIDPVVLLFYICYWLHLFKTTNLPNMERAVFR